MFYCWLVSALWDEKYLFLLDSSTAIPPARPLPPLSDDIFFLIARNCGIFCIRIFQCFKVGPSCSTFFPSPPPLAVHISINFYSSLLLVQRFSPPRLSLVVVVVVVVGVVVVAAFFLAEGH